MNSVSASLFDERLPKEDWDILKDCANSVARCFRYGIEAGDLITEGWLGKARFHCGLEKHRRQIKIEMVRWAMRWIFRRLVSTDQMDMPPVPEVEMKTSEEAELFNIAITELKRRMAGLSNRDKAVVNKFMECGSLAKTGKVFGLAKSTIFDIIRKVVA